MSLRLSVFNIPATLSQKEFVDAFCKLPGFKHADYVKNDYNQTYSFVTTRVGGIVEFGSFEAAEKAKLAMHNSRFHGSTSGIGTLA